jgi:hypothetical protein
MRRQERLLATLRELLAVMKPLVSTYIESPGKGVADPLHDNEMPDTDTDAGLPTTALGMDSVDYGERGKSHSTSEAELDPADAEFLDEMTSEPEDCLNSKYQYLTSLRLGLTWFLVEEEGIARKLPGWLQMWDLAQAKIDMLIVEATKPPLTLIHDRSSEFICAPEDLYELQTEIFAALPECEALETSDLEEMLLSEHENNIHWHDWTFAAEIMQERLNSVRLALGQLAVNTSGSSDLDITTSELLQICRTDSEGFLRAWERAGTST